MIVQWLYAQRESIGAPAGRITAATTNDAA
jgi:hypothetical protein